MRHELNMSAWKYFLTIIIIKKMCSYLVERKLHSENIDKLKRDEPYGSRS